MSFANFAPPLSSRLARACILIVDDQQTQLRTLELGLNKAGFTNIKMAKNGLEAVEITCKIKPDLVILDLSMPQLGGLEYCECVRGDPSLPRIPIIVQTSSDEREVKMKALSSGADDFLQKPIDLTELALRARIHLERYFMMQNMSDMCGYLKMECEQIGKIIHRMEKSVTVSDTSKLLNRHQEVLEEISIISSTGPH